MITNTDQCRVSDPTANATLPPPRSLQDIQRDLDGTLGNIRRHGATCAYMGGAIEGRVKMPAVSVISPGVDTTVLLSEFPDGVGTAVMNVLLDHIDQKYMEAWDAFFELAAEAKATIEAYRADDNATGLAQGAAAAPATEEEAEQVARRDKLTAIAQGMLNDELGGKSRAVPEPTS